MYNLDTSENVDMYNFAIITSQSVAAKHPTMTAEENLKMVEEKVKKTFPHRFKNQKKSAPQEVETSSKGSTRSSSKKSIDKSKIDASILQIGERFVRQGVFNSVDDYLKDAQDKGLI